MPREILGYVFGYGTLADPNDWLLQRNPDEYPETVYVFVEGYRRHWDMAADNAAPIHDDKFHADIATGARPDIYVASLGLETVAECRCNGVAIPVDEQRLGWFDQREGKLYERVAVEPEQVSEPLEQTLWTYIPTVEALTAFERGLELDRVFVPRYYTQVVAEAFRARGETEFAAYERSTRAPRCPERDLELVRAPGDAGV